MYTIDFYIDGKKTKQKRVNKALLERMLIKLYASKDNTLIGAGYMALTAIEDAEARPVDIRFDNRKIIITKTGA